MSKSKYEYVKKYEQEERIPLDSYFIVRIDGCNFHNFIDNLDKFSEVNSIPSLKIQKPNDQRLLSLQNMVAKSICSQSKLKRHIICAYGQSDEYSFLFNENQSEYDRRKDKLNSHMASIYSSLFSSQFPIYFNISLDVFLKFVEFNGPIQFDSRIVVYHKINVIQDYFNFRYVDCHINNLQNTTYHEMIKSGKTKEETFKIVSKSKSNEKNEFLFQLGINYNEIDEIQKKGTFIQNLYCINKEINDFNFVAEKYEKDYEFNFEISNQDVKLQWIDILKTEVIKNLLIKFK